MGEFILNDLPRTNSLVIEPLAEKRISLQPSQGHDCGKGGVSLEPSLSAPADIYYPAGKHQVNPHAPSTASSDVGTPIDVTSNPLSSSSTPRARLPREDGTDIGISSPVPLSFEAVGVISKLRRMKDEDEDYSRWKDVVFRAKAAESMSGDGELSGKRGEGLDGRAQKRADEVERQNAETSSPMPAPIESEHLEMGSSARLEPATSAPPSSKALIAEAKEGAYCPECYLPLHPDPKPEKLFIFLHAWRYTTKEWNFSTDMPFWAAKGYDWR